MSLGETFIISKKGNISMRTLSAVVMKEDGMYIASCLEVGTVSQGKTVKQAIKNLKEATELYLEECPAKLLSKPIMVTFEVASNASPA
jgi:predicted RNase H-like HicB family nuclease